VPGRYEISYWHFTAGTHDIDVLKGGGRLVLDLAKDHTVTGEFFIPAGVSPEKHEDAEDMAGTWRLDQGVVRFEQAADTYIRFVDWSIGDGKLESRVANGPWDIHTILRKIGS